MLLLLTLFGALPPHSRSITTRDLIVGGFFCMPQVFAPSARDAAEADAALRGLRFAQLGCSVGRTCFELADVFNETVGFDQTARRIQHAVRLQEGSVARYVTPQDGTIQDFHGISLDALGLESDAARDRVQFSQADACNIDVYKHGKSCFFQPV